MKHECTKYARDALGAPSTCIRCLIIKSKNEHVNDGLGLFCGCVQVSHVTAQAVSLKRESG